MTSKLQMDQYYLTTKKDLEGKGAFLDRRKFRAQQTPREKTLKLLIEAFEKVGVVDSTVIANEMMQIKLIHQLNKLLLCVVYEYYKSKDFDMKNVVQNFDEDFQEQLNFISSLSGFKKLDNKGVIYKFRQDFIIYLFIVRDFIDSADFEESYEETSYEDTSASLDSSGQEMSIEETEFPDNDNYGDDYFG
jgi:hypothetical protein